MGVFFGWCKVPVILEGGDERARFLQAGAKPRSECLHHFGGLRSRGTVGFGRDAFILRRGYRERLVPHSGGTGRMPVVRGWKVHGLM